MELKFAHRASVPDFLRICTCTGKGRKAHIEAWPAFSAQKEKFLVSLLCPLSMVDGPKFLSPLFQASFAFRKHYFIHILLLSLRIVHSKGHSNGASIADFLLAFDTFCLSVFWGVLLWVTHSSQSFRKHEAEKDICWKDKRHIFYTAFKGLLGHCGAFTEESLLLVQLQLACLLFLCFFAFPLAAHAKSAQTWRGVCVPGTYVMFWTTCCSL